MKKLVAWIVGLMMIVAVFAGCSAPAAQESAKESPNQTAEMITQAVEETAEKTGGQINCGFLCYTEEVEYHFKVMNGCKEAFENAGYGFTYAVTGGDATEARAAYDSFVTKGVNVIIDFTVTSTSASALSNLCEEAGIYYIAVDVFFPEIDTNSYTYSFGVDNEAIGEYGGECVTGWLKDNGYDKVDYILELNNSGFGESVRNRTLGVRDAILNGDFGLTEDNTYYMDITSSDQTEVKQLIQDHLTSVASKYDTIVLLVCTTEWQAAAISAIESANLQEKVLMFENDGPSTTQTIMKSVHDGTYEGICPLKGEVAFFPEKYAEILLPIAEDLIAGKQVEKYNHTLKGWLTPENIYEIYPE